MAEDLHRQMGVTANNQTWKLLDEGPPGQDAPRSERDRFLYRAYASAYHWMESTTGTVANHARGEHLIARAAIAVGQVDAAVRHAQRCLEICEQNPDVVEDWDLAFAHEALARAYAAAGEAGDAARHHSEATRLGAAIADDDDRDVFLAELAREPWFGLL